MTDDELRRLAEGATPGPWGWDTWAEYREEPATACVVSDAHDLARLSGSNVPPPDLGEDGDALVDSTWKEMRFVQARKDAAYIAAVSPDVVLGLLDRLKAAERALTVQRNRTIDALADEWERGRMEPRAYDRLLGVVRGPVGPAGDGVAPGEAGGLKGAQIGLKHRGGNAEDCPGCIGRTSHLAYPLLCPGDQARGTE